jgi:hypothetical protein
MMHGCALRNCGGGSRGTGGGRGCRTEGPLESGDAFRDPLAGSLDGGADAGPRGLVPGAGALDAADLDVVGGEGAGGRVAPGALACELGRVGLEPAGAKHHGAADEPEAEALGGEADAEPVEGARQLLSHRLAPHGVAQVRPAGDETVVQ